MKQDEKLSLVKSKIALITEDPATKNLILEGEDTMSGERIRETVDMVVLATGMEPATASVKVPAEVAYDDYGFIVSDQDQTGHLRGRLYQAAGRCGRGGSGCHRGSAPGYSICGEEVNNNG